MKIYQGVRLIFPLNPLDLVCLYAKEVEYIHTYTHVKYKGKHNYKKGSVPKDIAPFVSYDVM